MEEVFTVSFAFRYLAPAAVAASLAALLGLYRPRHAVRVTGMILKTIGWTPHGRLSGLISSAVYRLLMMRQRKFARMTAAA